MESETDSNRPENMETTGPTMSESDDNDKVKEEELTVLNEFIAEVKRKNAWKAELRKQNQEIQAWPEEAEFHKLDSSLKRNTAFIRKLKNYTEAQKDVVSREMQTLNLTKYIGEAASAIVEAKIKTTDVPSAIEIISFLHQRYSDMSPLLLDAWKKTLIQKNKDEKAGWNPSKLRVDLRFFADLIAAGVFTLKAGLPVLGQVLTSLVQSDTQDHPHLSIIVGFCKSCGDDFAGIVPRRIRILADKHGLALPRSDLLPPGKHKNVKQLLKDYFSSVCKHLQSTFQEWKSVESANKKILLTKGELHDERKDRANLLQVNFNKLQASTEQLADLLDEDMPNMEEAKATVDEDELGDQEAMDTDDIEASTLGALWEDDETKSFYESLVDLKAFIPAILYKDSSQQGSLKEDKIDDEGADVEEDFSTDLANEEEVAPPDIDDDADEVESQNASIKMQLQAFVAKLPTCISREMIDNAAAEFCMTLNTKANRKRLVKSLFSVHRNRQDLLPFYSRLVATLYPCMPEVAVDLTQYLKQEFRWLVRKKDQMKIESKVKVCRFIGEMVKFKMFPRSECLFCLKMLLFDFAHHHIEMACTLMETCGRFLYRNPESHRRTKIYLEQMMRKKVALSMDSRYSMMIENAFYTVNPPEVQEDRAIQKRPALEEYVMRLLFVDLSKSNNEKILRQIRKLDWNDKKLVNFTVACLAAIWNVKYYNIRCAASLLAGLVSYHEWVGPRIVDAVLEDIRLQMEINNPMYNQRRVSVVKYLAELYNYRLVDSTVVFKVLYSFISFGVSLEPNEVNPFDPPDHLLRIRLICVILDTCGVYFNVGNTKKKLDFFFTFFQLYYWRKRAASIWKTTDVEDESTFPTAVTNLVVETLTDLRPKIKIFSSLEEAKEAAHKIQRDMLKTIKEKAPDLSAYLEEPETPQNKTGPGGSTALDSIAEEDEAAPNTKAEVEREYDVDEDEEYEVLDVDDDMEDEEDNRPQSRSISGSRSCSKMENNSQEDDYEDNLSPLSQEDNGECTEMEDVHIQTTPKHLTCEEDEEFLNLFDKMVNDNILEARASVPRSQQVDIVAPIQVKQKKTFDQLLNQEPEDTMQFTMLLRKGNKSMAKEIAVPNQSDLARNFQKQELEARIEKEKMKRLTLQINERQEEEELYEILASLQRPSLVKANKRDKY